MGAGYYNGYVTARMMKTAGLSDWIGGATAAAFTYPFIAMCCFIMVDMIEWVEYNVYEWPITTLVVYGAIWTVANIVVCYFGAIDGYNKPAMGSRR